MAKLTFVDISKILCVDTRLSNGNWKIIQDRIKQLGIRCEAFIAGNGLENHQYSFVDNNELPPQYQNSCRNDSWLAKPHAYNAFKCHQVMINQALQNEYNILLIEDDIVITKDAEEILNKAGEPPEDWDVLYLGSTYHHDINICDKEYVNNPRWIKSNYNYGYYATILNKRLLSTLANIPPLGPMDWITCNMLPQFKGYCLAAPIALQKIDPSIVESGRIDQQVKQQWELSKDRL